MYVVVAMKVRGLRDKFVRVDWRGLKNELGGESEVGKIERDPRER